MDKKPVQSLKESDQQAERCSCPSVKEKHMGSEKALCGLFSMVVALVDVLLLSCFL